MARPHPPDHAGVPRISVVVPIYDVEAYLPDCLRSLAAQTVRDLEVVMVDDGSTDGSAAIADDFAQRDGRFRLIAQENHGLGHARNTGTAAATGDLLAFADSDDVVALDAYERLAGALDNSGSDFAAGNVLRLTDGRTSQSPFLAEAFARTRLKTHVSRFRPLLSDRTAWNKLFRRSFWNSVNVRLSARDHRVKGPARPEPRGAGLPQAVRPRRTERWRTRAVPAMPSAMRSAREARISGSTDSDSRTIVRSGRTTVIVAGGSYFGERLAPG